tara:strand:+ start:596 stop:2290 length:1695 start_codon:yes stop_codon:yes gene_type:complete
MSSITNQIIANIKKTSTNFNSSNFTNSENVVCIDTSLNAIGINRKNPVYSIDISGDASHNAIRVHNLYINNLAIIKEISCNTISAEHMNINTVKLINTDVSYLTFNLLSGEIIDVSLLRIKNKIDISQLYVHDLSSISFHTFDISAQDISTTNLTTKNLEITGTITYADNAKTEIIILDSEDIHSKDLCSNYILAQEISTNILFIKDKLFSLNEASFNKLCVDNDASINYLLVNELSANKIVVFNELSANSIIFNEISGNQITAKNIISNGKHIIKDGVFGNQDEPTDGIFDKLTAKRLDISKIYITDYLDNSGLTDLSNGLLILPKHKTEYETTTSATYQSGTITYDDSNKILKIYDNAKKWQNIFSNINYANLSLRRDISGNDIVYDTTRKSFRMHEDYSDNLIIGRYKSDISNIKYIPITAKPDITNNNKFKLINNNRTIKVENKDVKDIFEIHASVGLKYLNKYPGDVEPNVYTFGLYPDINALSSNLKDSIDNSFVEIKNTIIAFDNSYNFSNSSINYIGSLNDQTEQPHLGFNFYISSNKDIKYIVIDQFNATIKQLI